LQTDVQLKQSVLVGYFPHDPGKTEKEPSGKIANQEIKRATNGMVDRRLRVCVGCSAINDYDQAHN
jgi:hypothetical protein